MPSKVLRAVEAIHRIERDGAIHSRSRLGNVDKAVVEQLIANVYRSAGQAPPPIEWASSPPELLRQARLLGERLAVLYEQQRIARRGIRVGKPKPRPLLAWCGYELQLGVGGTWGTIWTAAREAAGVVPADLYRRGALLAGASEEALSALVGTSPSVVLTPELAVATEAPLELHEDGEGRLHNPAGPAVVYPDGWMLWALQGVLVPSQAVEDLASLDPLLALRHPNVEVRRILLELVGWERIVAVAQVNEKIVDEFGTLWRIRKRGGEDLVLVEVENATAEPNGRQRRYFLRVPPDLRTPREAIAWTFDMSGDRYAPESAS
jgi:Domain of unknown function (DUF6745)